MLATRFVEIKEVFIGMPFTKTIRRDAVTVEICTSNSDNRRFDMKIADLQPALARTPVKALL